MCVYIYIYIYIYIYTYIYLIYMSPTGKLVGTFRGGRPDSDARLLDAWLRRSLGAMIWHSTILYGIV